MKLFLKNHDFKYAAEQMLFTLFPGEKAEYPGEDGPGDNRAVISLEKDGDIYRAGTELCRDGAVYHGSAEAAEKELDGETVKKRLLQRIVKLSFYRAAVEYLGRAPVWGALTGVRPGKLAERYLEQGMTPDGAARELEREFYVSPQRAGLCVRAAETSLKIKRSFSPRDVSLYIGIPFCPTRCAYCSFVSQSVEKSMSLIGPFMETLLREIRETGKIVRAAGVRPVTVYMGGGTPTALSARQLEELMCALEENFDLTGLREYTVEAGRPDTITAEKLQVIKHHGVGRISVNPQTMENSVLEAIGRKHTAEDIERALGLARAAGIPAVNMDLIAGLPTDTARGFQGTLERVLSLRPENITVHTLALKKGSGITVNGTELPPEEETAKMLDAAALELTAAGYLPYYLYRQKYMSGGFENVGWCLPGFENIYNVVMMEELHSVIALGGGGATKLIRPGSGKIERMFNQKYPKEYIEGIEHNIEEKRYIQEFYNGIQSF